MNQPSYYGLPEEIWEDLREKVEEYFYKEDLGQTILGVYPTGPRLFGLEQEDPALYCLYAESVENILNPLNKLDKLDKVYIDHHNSYIEFVDLWQWISNFSRPIESIWQLIPCFQDIMFQETEISSIIEAAYELLLNTETEWTIQKGLRDLSLRAIYIFNNEKVFAPNINPNWGQVLPLHKYPQTLYNKSDEEIRYKLLENKHQSLEQLDPYFYYLHNQLGNHNLSKVNTLQNDINRTKYLKKLGEVTSKFYRSII